MAASAMAASTNALKRGSLSARLLRPATLSRSPGPFGTNAVTLYGGDGRDFDDYHGSDIGAFLCDLFGSLSTGTGSKSGEMSKAAVGKEYNWKRTAEGFVLRVDMPGLGKEDVKVSVKKGTLSIKGKGKDEFDEAGRVHNLQFVVSDKRYKIEEMKAEMKNGVLKVSLPKIKDEESGDVFDVSVE